MIKGTRVFRDIQTALSDLSSFIHADDQVWNAEGTVSLRDSSFTLGLDFSYWWSLSSPRLLVHHSLSWTMSMPVRKGKGLNYVFRCRYSSCRLMSLCRLRMMSIFTACLSLFFEWNFRQCWTTTAICCWVPVIFPSQACLCWRQRNCSLPWGSKTWTIFLITTVYLRKKKDMTRPVKQDQVWPEKMKHCVCEWQTTTKGK